jgi:hypothetical protein
MQHTDLFEIATLSYFVGKFNPLALHDVDLEV